MKTQHRFKELQSPAIQDHNENYTISDAETQQSYVGVRRAAQWLGFFLPYLKPGFSVLDCDCGVGSLTLDLAERVSTGRVVGIDRDKNQLKLARERAEQRGLTNVTFEPANVYQLRFADNSFDAVLAHTLLYHLSDQVGALREILRVLKYQGVAGIADDDYNTVTYSPEIPFWPKALDLWNKVARHNGCNPFYSRHLRGLMLEARFVKSEGHAVAAEYYRTALETRRMARCIKSIMRSSDIIGIATEQGWASQTELEEKAVEVDRWARRPDAFFAVMYCAAVGWK